MHYQPSFLPAELLAQTRLEADPAADKVIADIIAEGHEKIHHLFALLTSNRKIKDLPESSPVRAFFEAHSALPEWADMNLRIVGQDVFRRYGVEISMLLFYLSLPTSYCCWRGAHVLTETGRLTDRKGDLNRFAHRLMETAQFVIDVMEPGAFLPEGDGIQTTLKVRLIHASIRYYLKKQTHWDVSVYGEPINQQDMAGTLLSFSSLIIAGLEKMGAVLTEEEKVGYYHCWRIVGHVIGLRPELIPENYQDGLTLGFQIVEDQKGFSEDSKVLFQALIDFVASLLPKHFLGQALPKEMIRYFVDENLKGVLQFPKLPFYKCWFFNIWLHFNMFLHWVLQRPRHYLVAHHIGRTRNHFLQRMILYFNDHKEVNFEIPPSLRGEWEC